MIRTLQNVRRGNDFMSSLLMHIYQLKLGPLLEIINNKYLGLYHYIRIRVFFKMFVS